MTATTTDPDGDLDDVRWYVDDVLMRPGLSGIRVNTKHTLRAVARDDRGAATTDTMSIECI